MHNSSRMLLKKALRVNVKKASIHWGFTSFKRRCWIELIELHSL